VGHWEVTCTKGRCVASTGASVERLRWRARNDSEAIYRTRETTDPFSAEYEPYILAGLIAFDMGRTMGVGDKYEFTETGFRMRLRSKMHSVRDRLSGVPLVCLDQIKLASFRDRIKEAYNCLAERYFACLKHAKGEIDAYGVEKFRRLDPGTP
jgi:hypothetical protein